MDDRIALLLAGLASEPQTERAKEMLAELRVRVARMEAWMVLCEPLSGVCRRAADRLAAADRKDGAE